MKIYDLIKNEPDEVLMEFANDVHNLIVELYFEKYWKSQSNNFEFSGDGLEKRVNALNPQSVLDVGCGYNYWKGKINNLIGLDPYNSAADLKMHLYEYINLNPNVQHDVVLCLGSINFGESAKIFHEVHMIDALTKKGGRQYWRVNPGKTDHPQDKFPLNALIDFFPWSEKIVRQIAEIYDYEVEEFGMEKNTLNDCQRMYFVYKKN